MSKGEIVGMVFPLSDLREQSIESKTHYIAKQDQIRIESGGIVT